MPTTVPGNRTGHERSPTQAPGDDIGPDPPPSPVQPSAGANASDPAAQLLTYGLAVAVLSQAR